jgi:hypothetical protein
MALPPQRRLRESLAWSAVVLAITALAAVILWAVTGWLWLVVHEGLHRKPAASRRPGLNKID